MVGTKMSEAEWRSTFGVRSKLASDSVGLVAWWSLTDDQMDAAVRLESAGLDGAAYARSCARFRRATEAGPLVNRRVAGDAGHAPGCRRDHLLTEACADLTAAVGRAGA